ncbi:MAG: alpha-amylase family glycosyl hydrolase [Caldilineaceae bacterium]
MPQLNTDAPAVRQYLCDAATYWLTEFKVDGYRLDYAAGPSPIFWSEFQAACKTAKADCWLFGEATLAGADLRTYRGRLDGCLDFSFCRLIRQLCTSTQPPITLGSFLNHLQQSRRFFGEDFLLPSFIDNHDMNRFLWVAGNDKRQLRLALGLLFGLGASPILYYGTEVGLSQPRTKGPWREEARHPMIWETSQQDQELFAYCKTLIATWRAHPALALGTLTILLLDEATRCAVVERSHGGDRLLVAINVGDTVQPVLLPSGIYHHIKGTCQGQVSLDGHSVLILIPDEDRSS